MNTKKIGFWGAALLMITCISFAPLKGQDLTVDGVGSVPQNEMVVLSAKPKDVPDVTKEEYFWVVLEPKWNATTKKVEVKEKTRVLRAGNQIAFTAISAVNVYPVSVYGRFTLKDNSVKTTPLKTYLIPVEGASPAPNPNPNPPAPPTPPSPVEPTFDNGKFGMAAKAYKWAMADISLDAAKRYESAQVMIGCFKQAQAQIGAETLKGGKAVSAFIKTCRDPQFKSLTVDPVSWKTFEEKWVNGINTLKLTNKDDVYIYFDETIKGLSAIKK